MNCLIVFHKLELICVRVYTVRKPVIDWMYNSDRLVDNIANELPVKTEQISGVNFKDISDIRNDVRKLAHELPASIDLVVGIPRSGLLAANLFCLYRNLPMTDVDRLCDYKFIDTGRRYDGSLSFEDVDHVLVLDDSVNSGSQMRETKQRLAEEDFPFDITYGAVYASVEGCRYVDVWADVVPNPRVFEWNIMHHIKLRDSCVSINGVLCREPIPEEIGDEESYREFLREVEPNIVPSEEIGWLVTSRPAEYRKETKRWLDKHGISYSNLVMMDRSDTDEQDLGNYVEYKSKVYDEVDAFFFIEGSLDQAREIHERTGKAVYCYSAVKMFNPDQLDKLSNVARECVATFRERPVQFLYNGSTYTVRQSYSQIKRSTSNFVSRL